jgi:hypothetical protein
MSVELNIEIRDSSKWDLYAMVERSSLYDANSVTRLKEDEVDGNLRS